MSQNDFILADAAGAVFRADANSALQALATLSSGSAAPTTTYAYQLWADTTTNLLKQRNAANSAWLEVGDLGVAALGILSRIVANMNFKLDNSTPAKVEIGRVEPYITTLTPGAEKGGLKLHSKTAGALVQQIDVGDGVTLGAATGGAPGVGAVNATDFKKNGVSVVGLGKTSVPLRAESWASPTTNGAAPGSTETTTNKRFFKTLDFDTTTKEFATINIPMPTRWDEATITFRVHWTAASGSGGVAWSLQGAASSDNEALDAAYGTAVTVTDTFLSAVFEHRTAESAAITIANTPAAGDQIYLRLAREVADGADTLAVDAKMISVELFITTDAAVDQ